MVQFLHSQKQSTHFPHGMVATLTVIHVDYKWKLLWRGVLVALTILNVKLHLLHYRPIKNCNTFFPYLSDTWCWQPNTMRDMICGPQMSPSIGIQWRLDLRETWSGNWRGQSEQRRTWGSVCTIPSWIGSIHFTSGISRITGPHKILSGWVV